MRHRRKAKYFGVKTAHRKAMFRNMVTSLFRHGRITTTVTRAKELRRLADKLITLAKDGSLHSRRQALSVIMDKAVVAKLFSEIADQMANRKGGYTRIVRIGPRRGDGAMMCIIELVKESIRPLKARKAKSVKPQEVAPTVIPTAVEKGDEQPVAETEQVAEASAGDGAAGSEATEQAGGDKEVSSSAEEAAEGLEQERALEESTEIEKESVGSDEEAASSSEEEVAGNVEIQDDDKPNESDESTEQVKKE